MRLEGEQLGHYRLTRFIQSGGMGEIYLAEDLTLSRQVAIKVIKTEPALYPNPQAPSDAARLFQREMQTIAALEHPHILTLYEAGEQHLGRDSITYMVMPYCPEGSLADWIRSHHNTKLLSPSEVAQILQQATDALQYAHDLQVLHLDIKPSNFLVRRQQDPSQLPHLLLADFGVAKVAATSKLSGTVRGTLEYMAPEQLAGTPVAASDQYALGMMVYELLTGHTPFDGAHPQALPHMHANVDPKPPSAANPAISVALDAVILRALTKQPQNRFASVKEFASAFAAALTSSTEPPHPVQPPSTQTKPASTEQTAQPNIPQPFSSGANPVTVTSQGHSGQIPTLPPPPPPPPYTNNPYSPQSTMSGPSPQWSQQTPPPQWSQQPGQSTQSGQNFPQYPPQYSQPGQFGPPPAQQLAKPTFKQQFHAMSRGKRFGVIGCSTIIAAIMICSLCTIMSNALQTPHTQSSSVDTSQTSSTTESQIVPTSPSDSTQPTQATVNTPLRTLTVNHQLVCVANCDSGNNYPVVQVTVISFTFDTAHNKTSMLTSLSSQDNYPSCLLNSLKFQDTAGKTYSPGGQLEDGGPFSLAQGQSLKLTAIYSFIPSTGSTFTLLSSYIECSSSFVNSVYAYETGSSYGDTQFTF